MVPQKRLLRSNLKSIWVWLVALVGLGSGVVSLLGYFGYYPKKPIPTPSGIDTVRPSAGNLASGIRSKSRCLSCCTDLHRIAQDAPGKCAVMFGAESSSTIIHRKIN